MISEILLISYQFDEDDTFYDVYDILYDISHDAVEHLFK